MAEPDVVAALTHWLSGWGKDADVRPLMERARDELIKRRVEARTWAEIAVSGPRNVRAEAWEEAALACDRIAEENENDSRVELGADLCATAIRKLEDWNIEARTKSARHDIATLRGEEGNAVSRNCNVGTSQTAFTTAIENIIRDVAELPDRTSPADQPNMMTVSAEELRGILLVNLGTKQ